jgi:uncharacterized protein YndB with AHSA1/START domain
VTERVLEVSVTVDAEPETVFAYFTDPARYVQWMGSSATLDARPGGAYRVQMSDAVEAAGQFLEVDPPHRLVFTWGWTQGNPVTSGSTKVVVTFTQAGNSTHVLLRHYDLPTDEQLNHHRQGWDMYLGRLAARIHGEDPGPDPNG